MNADIQAMLARGAGRYALSNAGFMRSHSQFVAIEVEANGTVHQLNPKGKRDGILSPDRWGPAACIFVATPDGQFTRITKHEFFPKGPVE